jgi:hypothetical protein
MASSAAAHARCVYVERFGGQVGGRGATRPTTIGTRPDFSSTVQIPSGS